VIERAITEPSQNSTSVPARADKRIRHLIGHGSAKRKIAMQEGTVKFFNEQKGYGFIAPTNGGSDVFVHISALERAGLRTLSEGQKVSFDTEKDRRSGKTAVANIQAL